MIIDTKIIKLIYNGVIIWEFISNYLLTFITSTDVLTFDENLIILLAKNKNLLIIPNTYEWYDQLCLKSSGRLRVEVISAIVLNDAQKTKLYKDLTRYFDKEILLEYTVDSKIVAGIIIKYKDEVIDYSFRKKLLNLQQELLE